MGAEIKQSLHCQRKTDSLVDIRLPVVKDIFETFVDIALSHPQRNKHFTIKWLSSFSALFGQNWFIRIINKVGDFTYTYEKIQLNFGCMNVHHFRNIHSLMVHPPLHLNLFKGDLPLPCDFVKLKGNRYDYQNVMAQLKWFWLNIIFML